MTRSRWCYAVAVALVAVSVVSVVPAVRARDAATSAGSRRGIVEIQQLRALLGDPKAALWLQGERVAAVVDCAGMAGIELRARDVTSVVVGRTDFYGIVRQKATAAETSEMPSSVATFLFPESGSAPACVADADRFLPERLLASHPALVAQIDSALAQIDAADTVEMAWRQWSECMRPHGYVVSNQGDVLAQVEQAVGNLGVEAAAEVEGTMYLADMTCRKDSSLDDAYQRRVDATVTAIMSSLH